MAVHLFALLLLKYGAYVIAHRFDGDMVALDYYENYSTFTNPESYIKQLDIVVQNLTMLSGRIVAETSVEVEESSNYSLKSANETTNLNAAEVINKMLARQIVTDLIIYQLAYLNEMYKNLSAKFRNAAVTNPIFDDLTFGPPISRMVLYELVRNMVKTFNEAARVGDKLSVTWNAIRAEINNSVQTSTTY